MDKMQRVLDRAAAVSWWRITAMTGTLLFASASLCIHLHRASAALHVVPAKPLEPADPPTASLRYLPAEVQRALVTLCDECSFADSNGDWNATDVIFEEDELPRRRLTRTELLGAQWVIEYEMGGIATFSHTAVLSATSRPTLLAGSSCIPNYPRRCSW